jgi:hypothetical protein
MQALQSTAAVTTDAVQTNSSSPSSSSSSSSSSVPTTEAALGCYSESGSALLLANMLVVAAAASSNSSSDSSSSINSSTALATLPDCVLSLEQHMQSLWPLVQKAAAAGGTDSETSADVTVGNGHTTATTAGAGELSSASSATAAQGVLRYVSQVGAALAHHLAQQAQQDVAQLQVRRCVLPYHC